MNLLLVSFHFITDLKYNNKDNFSSLKEDCVRFIFIHLLIYQGYENLHKCSSFYTWIENMQLRNSTNVDKRTNKYTTNVIKNVMFKEKKTACNHARTVKSNMNFLNDISYEKLHSVHRCSTWLTPILWCF